MFGALELILIEPIRAALLVVLEWAFELTRSQGVAIMVLSLVFNLLLLPAYHWAEKVQGREREAQARMAPKLQEFKFAFAGQERYMMQRALYRQHRYHPIFAMRGLVPLALQIPLFIAAFGLLNRHAPLSGVPFLGIPDLGAPDGLLFGINLLPIVMTLLNLIALWLYSQGQGVSEKVQGHVIAVLFLVLLYRSPAGLVLYWTTNNLFSVFKSLFYSSRRSHDFYRASKCA